MRLPPTLRAGDVGYPTWGGLNGAKDGEAGSVDDGNDGVVRRASSEMIGGVALAAKDPPVF